MKQSALFTFAEKHDPKDEATVNARLLTRGGFVRKLSAGIYAYLPLGWRVIEKINRIIREEMNALGGQELQMSALVEKKYLEPTGRWGLPVGFEVKGKGDKDSHFTLGWTHEEIFTSVASKFIQSYKNLPFSAYQIQTKFRNEQRAQGGLLRGREFLMKDLYSFHTTEEDLLAFYDKVRDAYFKVFERCGLKTLYTLAPGGDFTTSNTHEFQVVSDAGEDAIFVCETCEYAENKEISKLSDKGKCPKCKGEIQEMRAIEVGNIFPQGTRYSEALGLMYKDKDGVSHPVVMGSYGIGVSRLMGAVVEVHHDADGIVWPEAITPFRVHLLQFPGGDGTSLYDDLQKQGVEVLYDERELSPGAKLAEADILGFPWRAVVSGKTGDKIEIKRRNEKESRLVTKKEFLKLLNLES